MIVGKKMAWSETAVGLEEAVGLSTGRRCSLKLAVFKSSFRLRPDIL